MYGFSELYLVFISVLKTSEVFRWIKEYFLYHKTRFDKPLPFLSLINQYDLCFPWWIFFSFFLWNQSSRERKIFIFFIFLYQTPKQKDKAANSQTPFCFFINFILFKFYASQVPLQRLNCCCCCLCLLLYSVLEIQDFFFLSCFCWSGYVSFFTLKWFNGFTKE